MALANPPVGTSGALPVTQPPPARRRHRIWPWLVGAAGVLLAAGMTWVGLIVLSQVAAEPLSEHVSNGVFSVDLPAGWKSCTPPEGSSLGQDVSWVAYYCDGNSLAVAREPNPQGLDAATAAQMASHNAIMSGDCFGGSGGAPDLDGAQASSYDVSCIGSHGERATVAVHGGFIYYVGGSVGGATERAILSSWRWVN